MAGQAGRYYDPVLMQLFINKLGCYPPGTLLELDDGRVVCSLSQVRDPTSFAQPLARCMPEYGNDPGAEPFEVDLAVEGSVRRVISNHAV